jgi:hypothetical protein
VKAPTQPDINDLHRKGAWSGPWSDLEPADDDVPAPHDGPSVAPMITPAEVAQALAAILSSPAPFLAVRTTPGSGKTDAAIAAAVAHVLAGGTAQFFVPNHALANQIAADIRARGITVSVPIGVAKVRSLPVLPADGSAELACKHHEAAEQMAMAGEHARRSLCEPCPHRTRYEGREEPCPAHDAGRTGAQVTIYQHTLLSQILSENAAKLRKEREAAEKGTPLDGPPSRVLVFIDESPAFDTITSLADVRADVERSGREADPSTWEHVGPLMRAALDGAEKSPDGATGRQWFAAGGTTPDAVDAVSEAAENLWSKGKISNLARQVIAGTPQASVRLARLARVAPLVGALLDAARDPDRGGTLWRDKNGAPHLVARARWIKAALDFTEAGGTLRLLDATCDETALRALFGQSIEIHRVDVADAPCVVRRFYPWSRGARSRHAPGGVPDANRLRGPLREVVSAARAHGSRRLAFVAHKPVAKALRDWLAAPEKRPAFIPPELEALRAELAAAYPSEERITVAHFGALRGLNNMSGADLLAVFGDPWPHMPTARAQARVIGVDPNVWAAALARGEAVQAWGRFRPVYRSTPGVLLHFGAEVLRPRPSDAPQWAAAESAALRGGRPEATATGDPATWKATREAAGLTVEQHAAMLGLGRSTYCRKVAEATAPARKKTTKTPGEMPSLNWPQPISDSPLSSLNGQFRDAPPSPSQPPLETAATMEESSMKPAENPPASPAFPLMDEPACGADAPAAPDSGVVEFVGTIASNIGGLSSRGFGHVSPPGVGGPEVIELNVAAINDALAWLPPRLAHGSPSLATVVLREQDAVRRAIEEMVRLASVA